MVRKLLSVAMLLVCSAPAFAQDSNHDGKATILVPIALGGDQQIPGANGSMWKMELWFRNGSAEAVDSLQPGGNCMPSCETLFGPGFIGRYGSISNIDGAAGILHLPPSIAPDFEFSARLLETTRRAQPTGVNLPIVREDQFFTRASTFLGIPVGSTIRSALRVYDPRLQNGSTVRVDVLAEDGRVLATRRLFPGNNPIAQAEPRIFPRVAGYDAILDLTGMFSELGTVTRYHLRVTPETPGMEYWAFVSVTDNESQHVLLITSE